MGMFIHRRKAHLKANPLPECTVSDSHMEAREEKEEVSVAPEPSLTEETSSKSKLTEEEINKLPFFSLKSLASTYGVDVKDKKTKELRKELLKKIREE